MNNSNSSQELIDAHRRRDNAMILTDRVASSIELLNNVANKIDQVLAQHDSLLVPFDFRELSSLIRSGIAPIATKAAEIIQWLKQPHEKGNQDAQNQPGHVDGSG